MEEDFGEEKRRKNLAQMNETRIAEYRSPCGWKKDDEKAKQGARKRRGSRHSPGGRIPLTVARLNSPKTGLLLWKQNYL